MKRSSHQCQLSLSVVHCAVPENIHTYKRDCIVLGVVGERGAGGSVRPKMHGLAGITRGEGGEVFKKYPFCVGGNGYFPKLDIVKQVFDTNKG